jgi:exodeoxyribonuclease VIII
MPEVAEQPVTVDYHRDFGSVSRSMLSVLKESPRLYHELYVERCRQPSPPSAAMIRGTRFDVLLLEPRKYHASYAISPLYGPNGEPWDRRKTAHKAAWETWMNDNIGKQPVTVDEHNELLMMVRGALRHSEIERVTSAAGHVQARLDWIDPTFGIKCKALVDKAFHGNDLIVDVKTAEDPSPEAFQRAVVRYGYHRQQAWYSTGWRIEFGETPRFLFCVVGSKPPHDAAVYELDSDAVNAGHTENEYLLRRLVELQSSGEWCPSWGKGVVSLGLPRWHDPYKSEVFE